MLLFLRGPVHKGDKFQVIPAATKNEIPPNSPQHPGLTFIIDFFRI